MGLCEHDELATAHGGRCGSAHQNAVALDIEEGMSPEEAGKKWMDANPDVWEAWLPAA